jgi:hypothetical protein
MSVSIKGNNQVDEDLVKQGEEFCTQIRKHRHELSRESIFSISTSIDEIRIHLMSGLDIRYRQEQGGRLAPRLDKSIAELTWRLQNVENELALISPPCPSAEEKTEEQVSEESASSTVVSNETVDTGLSDESQDSSNSEETVETVEHGGEQPEDVVEEEGEYERLNH